MSHAQLKHWGVPFILIACWIPLVINFDLVPCAFVAHTSSNHQQSMFHCSNGVVFIVGHVNSSLNVACMVLAIDFNFGLITPLLHYLSLLQLLRLSSRYLEACLFAVWCYQQSPISQLKLFVGFSLHCEQLSW